MITMILSDITKQNITAIVNAANTHLLAGRGVCGAIHEVAEPNLEKECLQLGGCAFGEARITGGYNLPTKFVIHDVGPKYWEDTQNEEQLLRCSYKSIFRIVKENQILSLAIPAISTGIYRFPIKEATTIAIKETIAAINTTDIDVIFCCFDKTTLEVYEKLIQNIGI
jgi:O-acetyl-ADP-ribose deacetylase (regulator of RNase III)